MDVVSDVNAELVGLTIVRRFEFTTEPVTGVCAVILELADDDRTPRRGIVIEAVGVVGLRIEEFGGGVTQLTCLRV